MDKLLDYLKQNCSDLFEFIKIVSIAYDKTTNTLVVKVVYKNDFNFGDECRARICKHINNFLNIPNLKFDIKSKKSLVDGNAITDLINWYLSKNYASILTTMQKGDISVNIASEIVKVNLQIVSVFNNFLTDRRFEVELKEFLERNYFQNFEVNLSVKSESENLEDVLDEHTKIFESMVQADFEDVKPVTYELLNLQEYIGQNVEGVALASKSLNPSDSGVTIAGVMNFLVKKSYVSKRKASKGEEKEYYSFVLQDDYGKVNCVYFPAKDMKEKFEELQENAVIAVMGDAEEFNGRMNFKVKSIALCELPKKEEEVIEQKGENKEYLFIKPEPFISLAQATLFDVAVENNNKFLKENDCVVFDVETTGLDANTCEIIEIGAVKVRDGKIIETFSCLIKPEKEIPDQITELTGITNEMVANCYTMKDVLQDFYKFTRNSVLVAYNIAFDYKFLYLAGNAQGYNFDNKQIDALVLAKQKIKGLKNYKLKTVVTHLGVSLENAHRAVHDATATAEAFIKLVDSDTVL